MLKNYVATISKLFFLSYLMMCFLRNLIGPLSGVSVMECYKSFGSNMMWYVQICMAL